MSTHTVRTRRWTRSEYDHMVAAGVFGPEDRIELLDGEICEMTPQRSRHATAIRLVEIALRTAFGVRYDVRQQLPVALDDISEPEPDVAAVRGTPRDYTDEHPREALLLVEVSESSQSYGRGRKLRAYARNGVPEYWLVNLVESRLEVYREPRDEDYKSRRDLAPGDHVTPLHAAEAPIPVFDLLP